MEVLFKKLNEKAIIPTRERDTDAGIDFYASHASVIGPGKSAIINLGVAWEVSDIPENKNVYIQIQSRSGMAFKKRIEVTNAGVIDQEYRGEFAVLLYNNSNDSYYINIGDRVCQGIVKLLPKFTICEVDNLSVSGRNAKGFGSSGK